MILFTLVVLCARFLILIICILLFLPSQVTAEFETEKGKLKELKIELEKEKEKLRATKKKEQSALSKLYIVNRELRSVKKDLVTTTKKISENKKRIRALTGKVKEAEKALKVKGAALEERIAEAYKGGRVNYLELLFASRTLADFINRSYYLERVIASDIELIKEIREEKARAAELRNELRDRTAELKFLTRAVAKKKTTLEDKSTERKKLYDSLNARRREYERRVAELEKSSRDLEYFIKAKTKAKGVPPRVTGKMVWPLKGRLVSGFGYRRHPLWGGRHFHTGIDIGAPYGRPIRAADGGEVILSAWWDGYGKAVVIDHGSRTTTVYGHMSRIYAAKGDFVAKGQVIGLVGSTGYSTGPHLHFEVRKSGKPVSPFRYLP